MGAMKGAWVLTLLTVAMSQNAPRRYPVANVVGVLRKIKDTLADEQAKDDLTHGDNKCFCKKSKEDKEAAITEFKKALNRLEYDIEEHLGRVKTYRADLEKLERATRENQDLHIADTAERQQSIDTAHTAESDLRASISALTAAIDVLSTQHPEEDVAGVNQLRTYTPQGIRTDNERGFEAFAPESSEIIGTLREMKRTFDDNLQELLASHADQKGAFDDLIGSREDDIKQKQDTIDELGEKEALSTLAVAAAKSDTVQKKAQLAAEEQFLEDVLVHCSALTADYDERNTARTAEISGVQEAITILSNDNNRDLFSKAYNLLQTSASVSTRAGNQVATAQHMLLDSAERLHSTNIPVVLSQALAASGGQLFGPDSDLSSLVTVIKDMISNLSDERLDWEEVKKKCDANIRTAIADRRLAAEVLADMVELRRRKQEDADRLEQEIKDLMAGIAVALEDISTSGKQRRIENDQARLEHTEQDDVMTVLDKAIGALTAVAEQRVRELENNPSFGSTKFLPRPDSGIQNAVNMLKRVRQEAENVANMVIGFEQKNMKMYETLVLDANRYIYTSTASNVTKTGQLGDLNAEITGLDADIVILEANVENAEAQVILAKSRCQYVLDNYNIARRAREDEIDALQEALLYLDSYKGGANACAATGGVFKPDDGKCFIATTEKASQADAVAACRRFNHEGILADTEVASSDMETWINENVIAPAKHIADGVNLWMGNAANGDCRWSYRVTGTMNVIQDSAATCPDDTRGYVCEWKA